jgi:hypothetical protein
MPIVFLLDIHSYFQEDAAPLDMMNARPELVKSQLNKLQKSVLNGLGLPFKASEQAKDRNEGNFASNTSLG